MTERQASDTETERFLVHGRGLPAQGVLVRVTFEAQALRLEEPHGTSEVSYDQLVTRPGGWNGESLLLEWEGPTGARSLLLDRPERFAGLVESLPRDMQRRLEGWRSEVRRSRRLLHGSLALVILLTMVPLVAISVLMLNADALARRAVRKVPAAWEEALGQQALRSLFVRGQVRQEGIAAERFHDVARALVAHVPEDGDWSFLLVDGPRASAAALPGGTIVVWTGLVLEMRDEAELAGLLAHEMQHVTLRHSLQETVRQLGLVRVLGLLLWGADMLGEADAATAAVLADVAYSRQQEAAAQAAAATLLYEAGWHTQGFETLLARLDSVSHELPELVVRHPVRAGRAGGVEALQEDAATVASAWQLVLDDLQDGTDGTLQERRDPAGRDPALGAPDQM